MGPRHDARVWRPSILQLLVWTSLAMLQVGGLVANEAAIPRFRWGQTKEKLFVTIVVKDMDTSSVTVDFQEARLAFQCLDNFGKTFALELDLSHDVIASEGKWDPVSRPDRFGRAVLVVMTKVYPFPWEALLSTVPESYRPHMDRDWTREDQKLEAPEEDKFFKEHETYLPLVTANTLEAHLKGVEVLVLALRHVACSQCKVAEDTFAAVAKGLKEDKKGWRRQVRLGVVDVRQGGRGLAQHLRGDRAFVSDSLVGNSSRQGCPIVATGCRLYAIPPNRLRERFLNDNSSNDNNNDGDKHVAGTERSVPSFRYHAATTRGRHQAEALLHDLENLVRPQFRSLDDYLLASQPMKKSEQVEATAAEEGSDRSALQEKVAKARRVAAAAGRALVLLPSEPSRVAARAAHLFRMRTDVVLLPAEASLATAVPSGLPTPTTITTTEKTEAAAKKAQALLFRPLEAEARAAKTPFSEEQAKSQPLAFLLQSSAESITEAEEDAEAIRWFATRTLPLLPTLSTLEESEPYEDLPLPVARLFLNGSSSDVWARATVSSLAEEFLGNITFLVRNASSKLHEWRQHGLPPKRFPSFGLSVSMRHNATKWGYLDMPKDEVEKDAWWRHEAHGKLKAFILAVLAGELSPTKMSEEPPDLDDSLEVATGQKGHVRKLVGRTCLDVVEASPTEALVEVFDEWRRDHPWRTLRLDLLSPMLQRWNITVYRLDFSYNECPDRGLPLIPAGYSGYYFVPRMAKERGKTWQKMKKLDPPFEKVLSFVSKHSEIRPKLDAKALSDELEGAASRVELMEKAKEMASEPSTWRNIAVAVVLLLLTSFFFWQRSKRRRRGGAEESATTSSTTTTTAAAAAAAATGAAAVEATHAAPTAATEGRAEPASQAEGGPRRRKGGADLSAEG